MKIEKHFNEGEFYRHVQKMLDYAKRTNKEYVNNLMKAPMIDLKPCKSCGRIVYVGKCCDNPDYQIEVIKEIENEL